MGVCDIRHGSLCAVLGTHNRILRGSYAVTYALTETIEKLLGPLHGYGVNAMATCPFHEDRTPSLSIHQDEGLWMCHQCGERGDLQYLANRLGEDLGQDFYLDRAIRSVTEIPPHEINFGPLANSLYDAGISQGRGDTAIRNFLSNRGIRIDARHQFWLGWNGSHISFPYWDTDERKRGFCHGIKYRDVAGRKTMEPGSKRAIYNVEDIRGNPRILVCEGESDTILAWSRLTGSDWKVCGIPGATVSRQQWDLWALDFLFAEEVLVAFDADEAGDKGAETALAGLGPKATRLRPDEGLDLTQHVQKNGALPGGIDRK